MRLGHIELFVKDAERARDFYVNTLGFQALDPEAREFVWLRFGHQEFLLRPDRRLLHGVGSSSTGITLVLYTEDLESAASELKARGVILKPVDKEGRCFTFSDPDGHWFQLMHPDGA